MITSNNVIIGNNYFHNIDTTPYLALNINLVEISDQNHSGLYYGWGNISVIIFLGLFVFSLQSHDCKVT